MAVLASHVPIHMPIVPPPLINSLKIDDHLSAQRMRARELLFRAFDLYQTYYTTGTHPDVTPELAEWAIRRTDHTTLRTKRNETTDFMRRMVFEATNPWPMRSVTTWPDARDSAYGDKLTPLIEGLHDHPKIGITLVLGYPHGFASPDEAKRIFHEWREKLRDVKNPLDFDTVINYSAWMRGDVKLVEDVLRAEGEAARETGITWKSIQKVSVHAKAGDNKIYGGDFFRSVYDSSRMALAAGADCVKTSTGVSAMPPFNYFVPADTGIIFRSLPMVSALADFNRENGTKRWPKFSGGNTNEADAAVAKMVSSELLGAEQGENIVFGTSYRFRLQLLTFIAQQTWPDCPFDADRLLSPYGIDVESLDPSRRGLPKPHEGWRVAAHG